MEHNGYILLNLPQLSTFPSSTCQTRDYQWECPSQRQHFCCLLWESPTPWAGSFVAGWRTGPGSTPYTSTTVPSSWQEWLFCCVHCVKGRLGWQLLQLSLVCVWVSWRTCLCLLYLPLLFSNSYR